METLLNTRVLVLNRLWQAINICNVEHAFSLIYQDKAHVVTEEKGNFNTYDFEDWKDFSQKSQEPENFIRTISFKIKIPRIIVLLLYDYLPLRKVKFTRKNTYQRDGNRCQYCGEKYEISQLNLDHVIPVSRGGKTCWDNVVCSCIKCNTKKGNRTLEEAGMKLIRQPKKPRWEPFIKINLKSSGHESWKHFVDFAYWNVELGEE
jgi:hypothetical protein